QNRQKNEQGNCAGQIAALHFALSLPFITHAQFLATGEHNFSNAPEVSATLGYSVHSDGDLLTDFKRLGSSAEIDHRRWIVPRPNPVDDIAVLVFCIELQERMGIGPTPFGDSALDDDGFLVVAGIPVMS